MELYRELLSRRRLSVISGEPDPDLARTAQRVVPSVRVAGRRDLEGLFGRLLHAGEGTAAVAKTLDLFGHSTASGSLLRLGDWVIDTGSPAELAFFRHLAARDVLPRLGIHAVRLLGCNTATTLTGRATVCTLAAVLGVEVFGTKDLLYEAHHDEDGFLDAWSFLLVSATDLRRSTAIPTTPPGAESLELLDLEVVPALPLVPGAAHAPRRIAAPAAVRQILRLIRRDAGAWMPKGPAPSCELALPSATTPGAYHLAYVLLDNAFLRFHPHGFSAPGVVYPVDDPYALRCVLEQLPSDELNH
jgi:hypothetical protein